MAIDWSLWVKIDSARVCDLLALFSGLNPDGLRTERRGILPPVTVFFPQGASEPEKDSYNRLKRLAMSAIDVGTLPLLENTITQRREVAQVRVADFLKWARQKGLEVPPAFLATAKSEAVFHDWKAVVEQFDEHLDGDGKTTEQSVRRLLGRHGVDPASLRPPGRERGIQIGMDEIRRLASLELARLASPSTEATDSVEAP